MPRLRLLVVLAMAFMVAFTGVSTASASSAYVQAPEISGVSKAGAGGEHPDTLKIKVSYTCFTKKGDNEGDRLSVTLEQQGKGGDWAHGDAVYTGMARATCNGRIQEKWVELHRVRSAHGRPLGYAHNGPATVEVVLKQVTDRPATRDDVQVDKESFRTSVTGAAHGARVGVNHR
jgi:hypothetical protein